MTLPDFSIKRPVTTFMVTLIAILLGIVAFLDLPVDLMPDIQIPMLSVMAQYQGVAPEEMETLVTRPLEEAFSAAPGVDELTSTSSEGSTMIRIGYEYGEDLDQAVDELRSRLDRRRAMMPEDMDTPTIMQMDTSQMPVVFLSISADDMDAKELRLFVEKNIQYRLERVPGVAQFNLQGGEQREIHVDLDLTKLRSLNMSVSEIVRMIRQENTNSPVGSVREGRFDVLLRAQGEFSNLEELRSLVITTRNGVPIYLRDVATIEDSFQEITNKVTVNGQPAMRMLVYKQSGANTVQVSDGIWRGIDRIHQDFENIRVEAARDTAEFIRISIGNLQQAALLGAILAVLVLLFFLRSVTSTLIIGTAIPVAVISTFALMYFSGFTLNVISFGGLALGIGMLVDNAIVVLENIYRHREEGMNRKEAASKGSKEVAMAVTASTLTTVAVFVPVIFVSGMAGQMFGQLAWVVAFALLCSLVSALTIVPMMCSRYLPRPVPAHERKGITGTLNRGAEGLVEGLTNMYGRSLQWALKHRFSVVIGALFLFGITLYLIPVIGLELQPEMDEGQVDIRVELEPGTRLEVTDAVMQRLARIASERTPEASYIQVSSGGGARFFRGGSQQNTGEISINLVEQAERARSAQAIANDLREAIHAEPGMAVTVRVSGGMFMMRGGMGGASDRLGVDIRGHDLTILSSLADQVRERMLSVPGVTDASLSRTPGFPEMLVHVDRAKASSMGLNVSDVSATLETAVGGSQASLFREEGDEFSILVRLREQDRMEVDQVGQIPITTPGGQTIPAESVIRISRQEGPVSISRTDQQRIVSVTGSIADRDLGSIVGDLREALRDINVPLDYSVTISGEWEQQQEAFGSLAIAAVLAILLVYMVMASQFESLRDPFIILFSIPLAGIGVVALLLLTNTTFNIPGFLGLIVLVGIVVNNAIVLIDYTNLMRREYHMPLFDAVIRAGRNRLRPILMTTITTVLALIPMSLGIGEGGEMQAPMALAIIGGLTTSTLITLIFIPVVYMILEERAEQAKLAAAELQPAAGD